jgi:hypothetical protein
MRSVNKVKRLGRGGAVAGLVGGLAVIGWLSSGAGTLQAQTGGGAGVATGTAATVIVGDAFGAPGGTAAVTVSFTSMEGEAGSLQLEVFYDGTDLSLDPAADCQLSDRLTQQQLSATLPPDQPDPPERRLIIGVFAALSSPEATFTDGDLATCDFGVSAEAAVGTTVDLTVPVDRVQVVRGDLSVICGRGSTPLVDCGAQDGAVVIGEAPTPTPTDTPVNTPVDTPTDTPTGMPMNTPTDTPEVGPTNTVTNTPEVSPTTPVPATDTPVASPTDTPQVGPTNTNTPIRPTATAVPPTAKPSGEDDGCSIVPARPSRPLRALVLLLAPALLLWGRRRRF